MLEKLVHPLASVPIVGIAATISSSAAVAPSWISLSSVSVNLAASNGWPGMLPSWAIRARTEKSVGCGGIPCRAAAT